METALAGQVITVIGGTGGLGLSAARAFLLAGAEGVVVTGRTSGGAADALGERGRVMVGDATDPQHAPAAIAEAVEAFGRCDGLYHVAGGSGRRAGDGPLHEVTDQGIEETISLNLASLIRSNRAIARHLLQAKQPGSILNMGSVLGWSPSPRHFATHVYAATKSAVIGFTKSCAAYYAGHGIRFNVLAPALVETPMSERAARDPAIMKFIARKQPLEGGRIGVPADLDAAAVYFLSPQSRFTTGQVLAVDGGWCVSDGGALP